MPVGALVAIPELQAEGIARMVAEQGSQTRIRFLASGAEKTQDGRQVVRYALLPDTEVTVEHLGGQRPARVLPQGLQRDATSGLLVYSVRFIDAAGGEARLREDAVLQVAMPQDPVEQLAQVAFHESRPAHDVRLPPEPWGPSMLCAREALLAWRDRAWSGTSGVVSLAGARVHPLPHQLATARRVLGDRQVRFLLADEVGLGKTIEAGLVMQALLAMRPNLRVLVIVPGSLLSQWFLELFVKFGGRSFLMLDRERMLTYPGNPWKDEQFLLSSHRVLEELDATGALRLAQSRFDLVVVDECHRMQPQGVLYKRVAQLCRHAPHLLLLSATPARQHADAYLALLALLQPQVYAAGDREAFAGKIQAHAQVTELLERTLAAADAGLPRIAREWQQLLHADTALVALADRLAELPGEDARAGLVAHVREHHQLDVRIIRHRRRLLARMGAVEGVGMIAGATRSFERVGYQPDASEQELRGMLRGYRELLSAGHPDGELPPRLAHWLLQVHLACDAHPRVLERLLAMRATVLQDPGAFASYRGRTREDETLSDVLRSDLSEQETLAHISASAACHTGIAGEAELIASMRPLCAAKKPSQRERRLLQRLQAFWKENPEEKVLIFTSQALAVGPLGEMLRGALSERAVATFGAHQDATAREEEARRFRDDRACWVMVSDPLGGEGRNFQFVSVVVHHDLPWSVAAVEQRIGRVDRIGRDGEVPSWVLVADQDDAIDSAWAEVLRASVGVFTAPSSGLEFIADRLECRGLQAALGGGAAGLRAILPELTALVAAERGTEVEREDALFQRDAGFYADVTRQAAAIQVAGVPVEAVIRWLRGMGGSARRDDEDPRHVQLRARNLEKPEAGTFDRQLALAREELGFFAVGHGLIDRALDDAASARWCSAQAWGRRATRTVTAWEGLRVVMALVHDLAPLAAAGLPLECLRRLFILAPPQRLGVLVRADGAIEQDAEVRALLELPFDARAGDTNLSTRGSRDRWTRMLAQGEVAQVVRWQEQVRRGGAVALEQAQQHLAQLRDAPLVQLRTQFAASTALAQGLAANSAARLGAAHADTRWAVSQAEEEERQGEALCAALAGARIELASIAYIVVA